MAITTMHELLKHELGDLYFVEKTVLKAIKKMSKEVSDPMVRDRLVQHYGETEQQIQNLEQAFESIGEKAKAQKCPGILGIVQEHDEFKEDEKPSAEMLEAFDLGSGLRVEHYEIAAYGSAISVAKMLGHTECANLLAENLRQEVEMEKFLRTSSGKALTTLQAKSAMQEAEESASGRASGRTSRGGARSTTKRSTTTRSTTGRRGTRAAAR